MYISFFFQKLFAFSYEREEKMKDKYSTIPKSKYSIQQIPQGADK